MMGVTFEAGNAHSSRAPHITLQWRVYDVPFLFTDFTNVRTSVLLIFVALGWNDFTVSEYILE